ncbi:PREDICTED: uncharacterized protein LOC106337912 [Brassica oleracea var. oleracea]|uniref:uncharacterized protein LOC106337912 n=1 Tax=Brassica oleracea var. oleracea TaxID=109376 RepID=UPI0006A706A3|nr:PREDICTED: uncharacterized protein LOC106337912 [Brassica oleracea var. oleracea]
MYKPQTLEDAFHWAITFIEIEEDKAAFSKKHAATKKSSSKDKEPDEYNEARQHYDKANRDGKNRKASNYQISDQSSSRFTKKQAHNSQGSEDTQAYCSYHKSKTHNTEESRHLQEWLLNKYCNDRDSSSKDQQNDKAPKNEGEHFRQVKEERDRQHGHKRSNEQTNADTEAHKRARDDQNNEQKYERTPPPRRVINVIMGGLQTCKDSVRSIKEYERKTYTSQKWGSISHIDDKPKNGYEILVVELRIGDCKVTRVLVDTGSSVDLIFSKTLQRMDVKDYELKACKRPLTSFVGDTTMTIGTFKLPVYVAGITKIVEFVVIESPAIYNAILGTPWIHSMKAVPSTYHQCIKFPTTSGTYTLKGNKRLSRTCFVTEHKLRKSSRTCLIARQGDEQEIIDDHARELVIQVNIDQSDPERCVGIGADLKDDLKDQLIRFLQSNASTFNPTLQPSPG